MSLDYTKFSVVKRHIEDSIKLVPATDSIHVHQAEALAQKFLVICHTLTNARYELEKGKIKYQSLLDVIYQKEFLDAANSGTKVTATERKIVALATLGYSEARESLELIEIRIDYIKANFKIFENAHIFYRNIGRATSY